ncbi:hypothetical protein [Streptomyces silvensis]|uniref:DNA-binding protein n=1 Tax=Streptomyces silvensis TaxID=1765722 RepID=A0A0W7X3B2_9ACTN|nr:hypothetical protein [Streptomyces silvensis]KUF17382.1 hypothetical protein AT728_16405 [Streptomyces silvensis]
MPQVRHVVRSHPLAPYTDKIAADGLYTLPDLAALMGISRSSAHVLAAHGAFSSNGADPRRGRTRQWTGAELLLMATRPVRITLDHAQFAPETLYRLGCRCDGCMDAHAAASREWKRTAADQKFPAPQREEVLRLVAQGTPVPTAAAAVGVTPHCVAGRATWDTAFADALDQALWSLCTWGQTDPQCGTAAAYRGSRDHTTPGCRGTACRSWRRGASRQERAG